jgi:DegV family protein with EDD domain
MPHIITDTTSCITIAQGRCLGIPVIPQVIIFGEDTFLEGVTMDNQAFLARLGKDRIFPKTAAPPVQEFILAFEKLVPTGEPILCLHPSSDVSGTVRSALTAAAEFPGADIRVIDTRLVASPLASLVLQAKEWLAQGMSVDTLEQRIREMASRGRVFFMVATLDYLAHGGRIGGAQALLGSLLQIKPILKFEDGKVDQFERERTHKRARQRLKEIILERVHPQANAYLSIVHAGVPEQGRALADELCQELGLNEVPVYDMPPAIVTHAGPGILGAGFFV